VPDTPTRYGAFGSGGAPDSRRHPSHEATKPATTPAAGSRQIWLPTPTEPAAQTRAGGSGWRNHRNGRRRASVNQERFAGRPHDNSGDHISLSSSCMVAISAVINCRNILSKAAPVAAVSWVICSPLIIPGIPDDVLLP